MKITREEAIAELKAMPIIYPITNGENDRASRLMQARDMAIKALKQMPVTTTAGKGGVIYYPQVEGVTPIVVSALKQEPCGDAIGREDMLDAIGHGTTYTSEELQRIIKGLPPVKPQPKMDLSELKRRILMEVDGGTDDRMLRYCDVCDRISDSIDKYQAESEDKYV